MKKLVCVLLSCFMIISLVGCGSEKSEDTNKEEISNADKKGPISLDDAKKKFPGNTYGSINETIDDGVIMFKLNGYESFSEIKGTSDKIFKAENDSTYVVVDIDIAASQSPLENGLYSVSRIFYLEDQDGIQYVADDTVTNHIRVQEEVLDYFSTINPKVLKKMKVAFNVPKGTDPFRLSILNEYNNDKWLVSYFK